LGASICTTITEVSGHLGGKFDTEVSGIIKEDSEVAAVLTFQYSYETSGEVVQGAYAQTEYLVPALNIVYSVSLHVVFDEKLCQATGSPVYTW
jgi:hypothetical protein